MPEKKRTYEVNSAALPALRLQARLTKEEEELLATRPLTDPDVSSHSRKGQRYSREVILRLIEWLKDS
jgi:hypothetical protein